jgi:hypothetical protein
MPSRSKKWRDEHRNEALAYEREWRKNHPLTENTLQKMRERNHLPENRTKQRISKAKKYALDKQAAFDHYGKVCICCGEKEQLFLEIDHINNDGNEQRKLLGFSGGGDLYRWLRKNNYPDGFQTLCANCNHGKYRNHGVCPHKKGL